MQKTKIKNLKLFNDDKVKVTSMGNITELLYMSKRNFSCNIKMIDKDHYMLLNDPTGEILECKHIENRSEGLNSLKRTLRTLRNTINTNIVDVSFCRWLTLTYAENMTDHTKIKKHFENFNIRLREIVGHYEYIAVREPQGRGAWHLHVIMIFDNKAPYIKNSIVSDCWKKGFVTIKKLDDVDNVGAYLTAYLADMSLEECKKEKIEWCNVPAKFVDVSQEDGTKLEKIYIKGARLYLYPPNINLYTCSKGIKKPEFEYMTEEKAQKKISSTKLTFATAIELLDPVTDFTNIIYKRYYNSNR